MRANEQQKNNAGLPARGGLRRGVSCLTRPVAGGRHAVLHAAFEHSGIDAVEFRPRAVTRRISA